MRSTSEREYLADRVTATMLLLLLLLPTPSLLLSLTCDEATLLLGPQAGPGLASLPPPSSIEISHCPSLQLSLTSPLPWPLPSLLLTNLSSLSLHLSPSFLASLDHLILLNCHLLRPLSFTSTTGTSLQVLQLLLLLLLFSKVEDCTFPGVKVYSVPRRGSTPPPSLVTVLGSEVGAGGRVLSSLPRCRAGLK